MKLSEYQNEIIKLIGEGSNLIVEAIAGSGKTTTAIEIAKAHPKLNFLLVTYNSSLKLEVRNKSKVIKNLKVENYNSIARNFYDNNAFNDEKMADVLKEKISIITTKIPQKLYDYIILDEAQDMKTLYFLMIRKFLHDLQCSNVECEENCDTKNKIKFIVMGDRKQTVYSFDGADFRFLTMADKLFFTENTNWEKRTLPESYRVPPNIANFITLNYYFQDGEFEMHSQKKETENHKVDYIVYNRYKIFNLAKHIKKLIEKYRVENTLILKNSIKDKQYSPLTLLKNELSNKYKIPFYSWDNDKVNSKKIKENKVEIATIASSKGREKDLVIILGFDESYFKKPNQIKIGDKPLDLFYVAMTRAREKLVILQDFSKEKFDFLKLNTQNGNLEYIEFLDEDDKKNKSKALNLAKVDDQSYVRKFGVTQLLNHVSYKLLKNLKAKVEWKVIDFNNNFDLKFRNEIKINFNDTQIHEDVSWINGKLITMKMLEIQRKIKDAFNTLKDNYNQVDTRHKILDEKLIKKIEELLNTTTKFSPSDLCGMTVIFDTLEKGSIQNFNQLKATQFNWVEEGTFNLLEKVIKTIGFNEKWDVERAFRLDGESQNFLREIQKQNGLSNIEIRGIIDAYDPETKTLWEFKNVQEVSDKMFYQILIYWFLLVHNNVEVEKLCLFNFKTQKSYVVEINSEKKAELLKLVEKLLSQIIESKLENENVKDNENFLEIHLKSNREIIDKYNII